MLCQESGTEFKRLKGSHTTHCSTLCRFLAKVELGSDCWTWNGSQDGRGYGQMKLRGRSPVKAHRVGYELLVGPIPEGLTLDHLCRNRACVNPDHLEPVTNRENTLRGMAPSVVTHRTGVCQRGHSMADAIIRPNGTPTCRPCENERQRRYYAEGKANA
jgi:hypothetical protein